MHFIHDSAALIEPYLIHYGLAAIFCFIFLESLGAPVPGESALIAASVMAIRGDFSVFALLAAVWIAAVLGDSTGYAIGRIGGRPLLQRYGWLVRLTPARLTELETLFRRRGTLIVFAARFIVLLRQLNGLVFDKLCLARKQKRVGGASPPPTPPRPKTAHFVRAAAPG